jgi:hypothetical protein
VAQVGGFESQGVVFVFGDVFFVSRRFMGSPHCLFGLQQVVGEPLQHQLPKDEFIHNERGTSRKSVWQIFIVNGSGNLRRFGQPRINLGHGSGSAGGLGQSDSFAVRRIGCATRLIGQGVAAAIRLFGARATGFGSGCRSPADLERLQTVLKGRSRGPLCSVSGLWLAVAARSVTFTLLSFDLARRAGFEGRLYDVLRT